MGEDKVALALGLKKGCVKHLNHLKILNFENSLMHVKLIFFWSQNFPLLSLDPPPGSGKR